MSDHETEKPPRFFDQPATQWDVFKYFLPLVLACAMWASSVEVRQARNESRFDALAAAMKQQSDTMRDLAEGIKSLNETKDERGQRLARIETKLDIFLSQKGK